MCAYELFYEMVKDNMVKDYRTPKVMAEVMINMLISDFVPEMLEYKYKMIDNGNKIGLYGKEMPIPRVILFHEEVTCENPVIKNHHYASADYVLADYKHIYLAELKTTNSSISGKQLLNMLWTCEQGVDSLYYRFWDLINYYLHSNKDSDSLYAMKYLYNVKEMYEFAKKSKCPYNLSLCNKENVRDVVKDTWNDVRQNKAEFKIIYISLLPMDFQKEILGSLPDGKKKVRDSLRREERKLCCTIPAEFHNFLMNSKQLALKYVEDKSIILSDFASDDNFEAFLVECDKKNKSKKAGKWEKVRTILQALAEEPEEWFK